LLNPKNRNKRAKTRKSENTTTYVWFSGNPLSREVQRIATNTKYKLKFILLTSVYLFED